MSHVDVTRQEQQARIMKFHRGLPHGFGRSALRKRLSRRGWATEDVQIHHILPRQFRDHPIVREMEYDVEADYNFMALPSYERDGGPPNGSRTFRPYHGGGHMEYNRFCKERLDSCATAAVDPTASFLCLLALLNGALRGGGRRRIRSVGSKEGDGADLEEEEQSNVVPWRKGVSLCCCPLHLLPVDKPS